MAVQRTNRHRGFTLVEMLVVITIIAILALAVTFAIPLLSGRSDGLRLQTASSELAAALRVTRSAAIMRRTAMALLLDVDHRKFSSAVVSPRSFAPDIQAKLAFASGIQSTVSDGGFKFFPDGSSTGGNVTLSLRGKQTKLCVDWLTGGVGQDTAC